MSHKLRLIGGGGVLPRFGKFQLTANLALTRASGGMSPLDHAAQPL